MFAKAEIDYLSHAMRPDQIALHPRNVEAVKNLPEPRTVTEVRRFIGLDGYYRKFIKDFSSVALLFTDLTKNNIPFASTNIHKSAFDKLKSAITSEPVLTIFDNTKPCNL